MLFGEQCVNISVTSNFVRDMEVKFMAYGRISDKQKEILEYMKQELRNKAFIFARYYETVLVPDSNRPLAKFVR